MLPVAQIRIPPHPCPLPLKRGRGSREGIITRLGDLHVELGLGQTLAQKQGAGGGAGEAVADQDADFVGEAWGKGRVWGLVLRRAFGL